jgi:endoglucanase
MEEDRRAFLDELLETPSPSGYEVDGQRRWVDYVSEYADEMRTDEYGNAIAVADGTDAEIAFTGHADEIGYIVREIDEEGFIHLGRIGGSDKSVSRGQRVQIHADDGPVPGVIGQTAVHLRDRDDDSYDDITEQQVDIGVEDGEAAEELVEVGDPITVAAPVQDLQNGLIAARGLDNRIGTWAAAEGFRRAVESDVDATVYAISTVQEELGLQGAKMVGDEIDPDGVIAVDVTHATDYPGAPGDKASDIELGEGPVIGRGSANHPLLVDSTREAASEAELDTQLMAAGIRTGTDADAFFTSTGGTPALNLGVPNRYMHTPVEVIDSEDLDATADLLASVARRASEDAPYAVNL